MDSYIPAGSNYQPHPGVLSGCERVNRVDMRLDIIEVNLNTNSIRTINSMKRHD